MPVYKIFNSAKFSPNPWVPLQNPYYNPIQTRLPYICPTEVRMLNRNMCRFCLLFPTIGVDTVLKILEAHHYKIPESIDTLLYIRTLQMDHRKEKKLFYKNTCARCSPIQKRNLIEEVLKRKVKEDRTILPNITFGSDCTIMSFEHELNFTDRTLTQNSTVVNIGNKENTNSEVEVVKPDPKPGKNCGCRVCYNRKYTCRIGRRR